MTRIAQVLFAALVAATLGAFFVTQRLKQSPRLVQTLSVTRDYSPRLGFKRASIRVALCARDGRDLRAFHDFEVPNVAVVRL